MSSDGTAGGGPVTFAQEHRLGIGVLAMLLLLTAAVFLLLPTITPASSEAEGAGSTRVMVEFEPGLLGTPAAEQALDAVGAQRIKQIERFNLAVVRVSERRLSELREQPGVKSIEIDQLMHIVDRNTAPAEKPPWAGGPGGGGDDDDTGDVPPQELPWGIDRVDAYDGDFNQDAVGTGAGINVAVLDTGIDSKHPDLELNVAGGKNFANGNPSKYDDKNGHGTHVAGTIAALDNGIGVIGVAPEANLYAAKVLGNDGSGWISDIVEAIEWAIASHDDDDSGNDINVINMSFGGGDSGQLAGAISDASAAGILLVAAAGNEGPADEDPGADSTVIYPASDDNVIAVSATTESGGLASFSSTGDEVELAAPGLNILSTILGGDYDSKSGTSMASPHVAGAAAAVWSSDSNYSAGDVRSALTGSAVDLGSKDEDDYYGFGLVQADLDSSTYDLDSP